MNPDVMKKIADKAANDAAFRAELLADPVAACEKIGIKLTAEDAETLRNELDEGDDDGDEKEFIVILSGRKSGGKMRPGRN